MTDELTVRNIMVKWLKEHGYDGLFSSDGDCACEINDLFPCEGGIGGIDGVPNCQPGYKGIDHTGDYDWRMYGKKEDAEADKEKNDIFT